MNFFILLTTMYGQTIHFNSSNHIEHMSTAEETNLTELIVINHGKKTSFKVKESQNDIREMLKKDFLMRMKIVDDPSPEIKNDDEWIWPLKQLPEINKEIHVTSIRDGGDYSVGFFDGTVFRHVDDKGFILRDVIAWRPLKTVDQVVDKTVKENK